MKRIFTISITILALFFTSCARSYYEEPSVADKEATTPVHNVNNIFN